MGKLTPTIFVLEQWTKLPPPLQADLSQKTVMVTGANTGIGLDTAEIFASMHPRKLIVTCRNEAKGKAAIAAIERKTGYRGIELAVFDLSEFSSVIAFAETFKNKELDILVANTAVETDQYAMTKDGWETTLQVNHLSTALLSILLVPNLVHTAQAKSTNSRLVIVSSDMHYWTKFDEELLDAPSVLRKLNDKNYCTPQVMVHRYSDSKLLNVLFTRALAEHMPVSVPVVPTSVNPGFCISELRRNHKKVLERISFALMEFILGRTAEQGAPYVSTQETKEPSDFVISREGKIAQDKIWEETIGILSKASPEVRACVDQYLTA